jgi:hypothetical protein
MSKFASYSVMYPFILQISQKLSKLIIIVLFSNHKTFIDFPLDQSKGCVTAAI